MADLTFPFIAPVGLSKEEDEAARKLFDSFLNLTNYVKEFQAALNLFDFAESEIGSVYNQKATEPQLSMLIMPGQNNKLQLLMQWQLIAARDGAITIFNFGKTLEAANKILFKSCPTWSNIIVKSEIGSAFSLWKSNFADFVGIRHTVAHAAELFQSERHEHAFSGKADLNFLSADGSVDLFMSGNLNGREFISTFKQNIVSYELSSKTAALLSLIAQTFFDAFKPVEEATRNARRAKSGQTCSK